jgi:hypothetical protein
MKTKKAVLLTISERVRNPPIRIIIPTIGKIIGK